MGEPRYLYYTATTLDGFIADEADNLDWLLTQPIDEDGPMNYGEFIRGIGVLAMGATTYRWVVSHEIEAGRPWPYDIPCLVFTHGDLEPVAESVRIVSGPPAEHRAAIEAAAGDGDVWVVGGGDLAGQFADAGMLDEMVVSIAPVTLGAGRPLLPRRFDLDLVEVARNGAFMCARYGVIGPRSDA